MRHFLSYVEISGHSSLMLSTQNDLSKPPRVLMELGLNWDSDRIPNRNLLKHQPGLIVTESNASRLMYSRQGQLSHRTFEITEEELERFYKIIERDSVPGIPGELEPGTPDYQYFIMNCKKYAIGVLKEVGIHEAMNLENFFIQIPGSPGYQLTKLNKHDFSYPLKDGFILELSAKANDLMLTLMELRPLLSEIQMTNHRGQAKNLYQLFLDSYNTALATIKHLKEHKTKAGFDEIFDEKLNQCAEAISNLAELQDHVQIKPGAGSHDKQAALVKIMIKFDDFKTAFEDLEERLKLINEEYEAENTQIAWNQMPVLSERVDLSTMPEEERLIYFQKAQAQEMLQNLDEILSLIDFKIIELLNIKQKKPKEFDRDHYLDLNKLREILHRTLSQIQKSNQDFVNSLNLEDKQSIKSACSKQAKVLDGIVTHLKAEVETFKPHARQKTNLILRLIYQVLLIFKIKPLGSQYSTQQFIERRITHISEQLKEKRTHYNKKFKSYSQEKYLAKKKELKPLRPHRLVKALFPKQEEKKVVPNNQVPSPIKNYRPSFHAQKTRISTSPAHSRPSHKTIRKPR